MAPNSIGLSKMFNYPCPICEKSFSRPEFLQKHQLLHSDNIENWRNSFRRNILGENKVKVRRLHLGDSDIDISSSSENVLQKSYTIINPGQTSDSDWDPEKSPSSTKDLEDEVSIDFEPEILYIKLNGKPISPSSIPDPYEADANDSAFLKTNSWTIRRIQRSNAGSKAFTCILCKKNFGDFSKFLEHKRRHSLGTPIECKICNINFTKLTSLIKHFTLHKSDDPKSYSNVTSSTNKENEIKVIDIDDGDE